MVSYTQFATFWPEMWVSQFGFDFWVVLHVYPFRIRIQVLVVILDPKFCKKNTWGNSVDWNEYLVPKNNLKSFLLLVCICYLLQDIVWYIFIAGYQKLWGFLPGWLHSELFPPKAYVPQKNYLTKKMSPIQREPLYFESQHHYHVNLTIIKCGYK